MKLLKSLNGKILIEGHRGAEALALGNSWSAIEAGFLAGADLLEIDVQRTFDGILVLHNGYQIQDGRWLRELKYSDVPIFEPDQPQLVVLSDVFEWVKDRSIGLSLDIKNGFGFEFQVFNDTLSLVEKHDLVDKVMFVGWDHAALLKIKDRNPIISTRGLIRGCPVDTVGLAKAAKLDAINLDADMVTRELIESLHAEGIAVTIAELVNPNYVRASELGADIICCADPRAASSAIRTVDDST
jgi:glycerophosphoryl diester phosphodiesterase